MLEDYAQKCSSEAGQYAVLLTADLPSSCQQKLCGEIEWNNIRLDRRPAEGAAPDTTQEAGTGAGSTTAKGSTGAEEQPKKKHKSQRRMEKEQEYYERQQRMHEAQKAKAEAMKRTKCKFFAMGKCKEGASCRFGHD